MSPTFFCTLPPIFSAVPSSCMFGLFVACPTFSLIVPLASWAAPAALSFMLSLIVSLQRTGCVASPHSELCKRKAGSLPLNGSAVSAATLCIDPSPRVVTRCTREPARSRTSGLDLVRPLAIESWRSFSNASGIPCG